MKRKIRFSRVAGRISNLIGKAIGDYNLIEDNDRILVAVSGGKDSLTLLSLLKERQKWAPIKFEIFAAHIKTDFACSSCIHNEVLEKFFKKLDVEHVFKEIKVLDKEKKTTCFWCSWNRRKALFEIADQLKCNKIAFGHHKDDIVETTLLNLFFLGEFSTMNPYQEMFDGKIIIIRPLCYVEEFMTKKYAQENGLPNQLCKCPFGQDSKRKYVKGIIKDVEKKVPGMNIKTNIFKSLARVKADYVGIKNINEDNRSLIKDE
jgi:tRNA 2-thiocytidine biosynthesis protein TtcA